MRHWMGLVALMAGLSALPASVRADLPVQVAHPGYPHDRSDLEVDPDTHYGVLPNGLRYVLYRNRTKGRTAAIRFQVAAGSMQESDQQRGLAHFVEHMAFNGTTHIPEGELPRLLARNAFQFGTDANAFTDYEKTDYVLNLPSNTDQAVDTALFIVREVAGNLTFDAEAVERERGVILSEERMRASGTSRGDQAFIETAHPGELYAVRNPIGLTGIIRDAPRQTLIDFYQDFYRPDNAILVVVGDFDLGKVERKIRAAFGDWQPSRPGPLKQNVYGARRNSGPVAAVHAETGMFESETATWFRPFITTPDNANSRVGGMAKYMVTQILNTRFRRLADDPSSPFISASLTYDNRHLDGNFTQLQVVPRPGHEAEAFAEGLKRTFQLARGGVSAAEFADFMTQYDAQVANMVAASRTRSSSDIADEIMTDIDEDGVYQSSAQYAALWKRIRSKLNPSLVNDYAAHLLDGDGPVLYRQGENAGALKPEEMKTAYAVAASAAYQTWNDTAVTTWPYASFGPPVKPVSAETVARLKYRHYVFPNGVTANVRNNPLFRNQVLVSVRFGGGYELFSPDEGLPPIVTQLYDMTAGGLGRISREDMLRALSDKTFSAAYQLDSDNASLTGYTTPDSFDTQMQVLMAYTEDPGFRESAFARFHSSLGYMLSGFDASPEAAMAVRSNAWLAGGDRRYVLPGLAELEAVDNAGLAAIFRRTMTGVPVEVTITGDISDERALKALEATFATLPPVPASFVPAPGGDTLKLPVSKDVQVFPHHGRDDQSVALIVFPTTDAIHNIQESRRLTLMAAILSARLSDDLREGQGATYDIAAQAFGSEVFAGYGYVYVQCTLSPAMEPAFEAAVAKAVQDLRDHDVTQDELDRAREPLLDGVNDSVKTNEDWQATLAGLYGHPALWTYRVDVAAQYRAVSVADIRAVAQTWLKPESMLRMQAGPEQP